MELVNYSVTNFRSITKAHNIPISDIAVLIGKNNEGKSNILKGLDIAMSALQLHAKNRERNIIIRRADRYRQRGESSYYWKRDFPISLQSRTRGLFTIFRLEFKLSIEETDLFKKTIKSNLNGTLPIEIKIGKNNVPSINVIKRGRGSKTLNAKSGQIAKFIGEKIVFNYIPAIRTHQEAMDVVRRMLSLRLVQLEEKEEYIEALSTIEELQKPVLEELSVQIKEPLTEFLPSIKNVCVEISDIKRRSYFRNEVDIIVDDGTPTNLVYKGDGVKSLAALGLLKHQIRNMGASLIAIEEPESHLHPGAIHQLNKVIYELANNNQVVITTHNPLFVDRNNIKSNIIVDCGKANSAKSIKQVRDILGIKASDNLINASYVLIVEGGDDIISIKALLSSMSEKISNVLKNNLLVIDEIGGAGNLSYKLTLLNNSLCVYHVLLDNDDAGRKAFERAENDGLLTLKNTTFINCNGSPNSEFEDTLEKDLYANVINTQFGVDIDSPKFRGNAKWSERMRDTFLNQGKRWSDMIESDVKYTVANEVKKKPGQALNIHKRNSIDALKVSLENLIKN